MTTTTTTTLFSPPPSLPIALSASPPSSLALQKHKTGKNDKTIISMDEKHALMMNDFDKIENKLLPKLRAERQVLHDNKKLIGDHRIDDYMDLRDKIRDIDELIKIQKRKRKQYLLDNSIYIFNYFEEKKNISESVGKDIIAPQKRHKNSLNAFFKVETQIIPTSLTSTTTTTAITDANTNSNTTHHSTEIHDKFKNSREYWANVNNEIVNMSEFIVSSDVCDKCRKGELISQEDEGSFICNHCGITLQYIVDSDKPSYKEPPSEVSYTAYLRLNHFKEILSQFQAKETTQIPDEVIEAIRSRIKKERIHDLSEMTYMKTRDILRKLGFNKYFEHIQYINCKFGINPPIMCEELVETLCVLFIEIQAPWALHCPSTRTNFFNYAYTLYQLCKLLGQIQFLPFIPLLKDPMKTIEQDDIWKKVCGELGWQFYPTPRN